MSDQTEHRRESYYDIAWRQFRRNRLAFGSLCSLVPVVLLAIFAPLIASNEPFIFWDGKTTSFPWLVALFHQDETVDYIFNMAMLAFVPSLLIIGCVWHQWRKRQVSTLGRIAYSSAILLGLTLLLSLAMMLPALRPNNRYRELNFPERQFLSEGQARGIYPPIPFGVREQDINSIFKPPLFRKPAGTWSESNDGVIHLLGTDELGRDVLVRMIFGTRLAVTIGFVAVGIYLTIGCFLGAVAGYFGGIIDALISRTIEVVLLFPSFFLILALVAMVGRSVYVVMIVIGLTGWPTIARLIRGEVLKQRALDYVAASRALGASHARIIFRHILPNSLGPAFVAAPFGIASAISVEAALSLLGVGVRPPAPSWGTLLNIGRNNYSNWWLIVVPSVAIFFSVTVFNLIGSGLRDAMDPRLRETRS